MPLHLIPTVILSLLTVLVLPIGLSSAADQPTLLLMGDDADEDTVTRHSRIFNRVHAAMRSQMQAKGFHVYDETAVSMDVTNPNRVRRPDTELVTVARTVSSPPIDVIAIFQIYASARKNPYADINQLRIRVAGRLLQVQTGRTLGNFESALGPKGLPPLPVKCDRDCILEKVGDEAKLIAKEVGYVLARRLDQLAPPTSGTTVVIRETEPTTKTKVIKQGALSSDCQSMSTAYTIVLDGYEGDDLQAIESMLKAFRGYEHHRPVRTQTRYTEIWYETCSTRARLERNFRHLAEQLSGDNKIGLNGNKITLERIAPVAKR